MARTLTRKDYIISIVTGVAIAVASLFIRYASHRIENKQEVRLLGKS